MGDELSNRYEFVFLFDVENGNPNGDPDAGNMPRVDPETNLGIVTDVCLKRKVRNYVEIRKNNASPYEIYVREKAVLNRQHERSYDANPDIPKPKSKRLPPEPEHANRIRKWMCDNFFDIRTFGAVMSTEVNAGQVRGPIQINFARSIDPVFPMEVTITRMAVTNEADLEKERTMGQKHIVPYGLYRAEGYISAKLAQQTGFTSEDLELFWESLINMLDHDHSAARGKMAARKLVVFKHDSELGNAPAHKLFDTVTVETNGSSETAPRSFNDYNVTVDKSVVPDGVSVEEKL